MSAAMHRVLMALGGVALGAAVLFAAPVSAKDNTEERPQRYRNVDVMPHQSLPGVDLKLRAHALGARMDTTSRFARNARLNDAASLPNGQRVEICFEAAKDGYVTVWSDDLMSHPSLIYPNAHSHGANTRAAKVEGGQEVCIGSKGAAVEGYDLVVRKKDSDLGQLYVTWTEKESDQVGQDEYVRVIHPKDQRNLSRSAARTSMAIARFTYTIADAASN
jgi:hypothetical protein